MAKFPTLSDSRTKLDEGSLLKDNEAMLIVLADNERLKAMVKQLEERCESLVRMHNAMVEKTNKKAKT